MAKLESYFTNLASFFAHDERFIKHENGAIIMLYPNLSDEKKEFSVGKTTI